VPTLRCRLVPVELAGYVPVVEPVADRAAVRARGRVAAAQPVLDQRLHLRMGEPVSQLHRRVARYGGEDPLLPARPRRRALHDRDRLPKRPRHVALCQGGDRPVYPEGGLAERLHLEAVHRELLQKICRLRCVPGLELDHLGDEQGLYGGYLLGFGVGEPVEQGALVGYVLVDDPRGHRLVHEDVAGPYLAHHAQVPKMRQTSSLHAGRGAGPREGGGGLLYAPALLREVGRFWRMGSGALGGSEEALRRDRAALVSAGRLLAGRYGRGRPVLRAPLRRMSPSR